jgi:hypothetical protein
MLPIIVIDLIFIHDTNEHSKVDMAIYSKHIFARSETIAQREDHPGTRETHAHQSTESSTERHELSHLQNAIYGHDVKRDGSNERSADEAGQKTRSSKER